MTQTTRLTHCPTCGAKITRPGLSICAYCTAPLGLEQPERGSTQTMQRLERMQEHDRFPDAMAWNPPTELEDLDATRQSARGLGLIGLSVALFVVAVPWGLFGSWTGAWPAWGAGLLCLAFGALSMLAARARIARVTAHPLLKRPAIVTSRRSETSVGRGQRTVYYFQLEFADGSEGEFSHPGRGTAHELLVSGNTGVAYTRRQTLVAFRQIRV
jgi:hypothetical protein